ncbi:MAG TPA: alpha/beta hydrolase [Baekduia sp.]|nr:alpha/beta hydrolase [Baekduia sp.]
MASALHFHRDGVELAGIDFGGEGPAVLLLHGLAGYAGEWTETAGWLRERAHVVALDARGHGHSERNPADVSRAAHVADAAYAVERFGLSPVVVVGHSLGGLTALLLAAEHPHLVRGLVMADAGPRGGGEAASRDQAVAKLGDSLRRWPVPFASVDDAVEFFGGPGLAAEAWAGGLELRDDGWWPRFDVDVMIRTLQEAIGRSYWDAWERVVWPSLVVRSGEEYLPADDAALMVASGRDARLVELPEATHDLHLDRPGEWRAALSEFIDSLGSRQ